MKNKKQAFTFVELIVASTILIILSTLGFFSYSKYISNSRDSERISNIANLSSGLNTYKKSKGLLPIPANNFILTNSGTELVMQGKLSNDISLSSLNTIPFDPALKIPYLYGTTKNRGEFQIATTLENNGNPIANLEGNYTSVAKNILPSLLIAYNGSGSVDISKIPYKNMFILDGITENLPYDIENGVTFTKGELLSNILSKPTTKLWQNGDYKNCTEICNAGKSVGDGEYQILNASGSLENINCYFEIDSCETKPLTCYSPNPTNASLTHGSPTIPDQPWQNTNSGEACYYTCNTHYHFVSGTCTTDTYTVTFNTNGGSAVAQQTVNYNSQATAPTDPTKTGHTFDGWYSDAGLTNSYDFATPVTADITLYAKWTLIPYFTTTWKVGTAGYGNGNTSIKFRLRYTGTCKVKRQPLGGGTISEANCASSNNVGTYNLGSAGDYKVWIETANLQRFYNTDNNSNYFGKLLAVTDWGGTAWTSMEKMFFHANKFNSIPTNTPNMTQVTSMYAMFVGASAFNQPISSWNTSKVTSMGSMFKNASAFNQDLTSWDVSKVTNHSYFRNGATSWTSGRPAGW